MVAGLPLGIQVVLYPYPCTQLSLLEQEIRYRMTRVGLKNHHSTTTSHVRFVMKMAKSSRKADASKSKPSAERSSSEVKMQASITALQKENKDLKTYLQRLESKLDSVIAKNDLEVGTKSGTTKRSRGSSSNGDKDDENK